jgi:hypothetical protein
MTSRGDLTDRVAGVRFDFLLEDTMNRAVLAVLAVSLVLSSCGGGEDSPPGNTDIPDPAQAAERFFDALVRSDAVYLRDAFHWAGLFEQYQPGVWTQLSEPERMEAISGYVEGMVQAASEMRTTLLDSTTSTVADSTATVILYETLPTDERVEERLEFVLVEGSWKINRIGDK